MRIAIISTMRGSCWGGSEELWADAAGEALARGHEVLMSIPAQSRPAPRVGELLRGGAAIHVRRASQYGRFDPLVNRFTFPVRKLLAWRPDVALISQGNILDWYRHGELERFWDWSARRDVPFVLLSHGNFEFGLQDRAMRERTREIFGRARRAAFVSPRMVALAERQMAMKLPNAVVVSNPVNLSSTEPVPWPAEGGPARFAHVARAEVTSKGPDLLMEALSRPPWPERDWRLSIYGEGPGSDYLKELSGFYGLADRVEFPGHTRDIRGVWARHHLLTLPSRTEGLPLAVVEAALCGRPVLVTDVGGVLDWVNEPANGFVADAPNTRCVASALERAWAARPRWQEIGRRARELALPKIDPAPGATLLGLMLDDPPRVPAPPS